MIRISCIYRLALLISYGLWGLGKTTWKWRSADGEENEAQTSLVFTRDGNIIEKIESSKSPGDEAGVKLFTLEAKGNDAVRGLLGSNNPEKFNHFKLKSMSAEITPDDSQFPAPKTDEEGLEYVIKGISNKKITQAFKSILYFCPEVSDREKTLKDFFLLTVKLFDAWNCGAGTCRQDIKQTVVTFARNNITVTESLIVLLTITNSWDETNYKEFIKEVLTGKDIDDSVEFDADLAGRLDTAMAGRLKKRMRWYGYCRGCRSDSFESCVVPGLFGIIKDHHIDGYSRNYWGSSDEEKNIAARLSIFMKAQQKFGIDLGQHITDMLGTLSSSESKSRAILNVFRHCITLNFNDAYNYIGNDNKLDDAFKTLAEPYKKELYKLLCTDFVGLEYARLFAKIVGFELSTMMVLRAIFNPVFVYPFKYLYWVFTADNPDAKRIKWDYIVFFGSIGISGVLGSILTYITSLLFLNSWIFTTWFLFSYLIFFFCYWVGGLLVN